MSNRDRRWLWSSLTRQPATSRHRIRRHVENRRFSCEPLERRHLLAATLWVDPFVTPSGNIFSTISAAVAAAHNGDTIKVEAGHTYNETVAVNKSLTLIGGQVRVAGEPTGASIISPTGFLPTGFDVTNGNVTIKNFTIQSAFVGINIEKVAPVNIAGNNFSGDAIGVVANSPAAGIAKTTVSGSQFAGYIDGIVATATARNVTISGNQFAAGSPTSTDRAAISVSGTSQSSNVQIVNNHLNGADTILIVDATKCKVDGNTILNPPSSARDAIRFGGAVTASEINGNVLVNTNSSPTIGITLFQIDFPNTDGNSGNILSGNSITGFAEGIAPTAGNHNTISGNTVAYSQSDGISVTEDSDTLSSNTVIQNQGRGIGVLGNSSKISSNTARDNLKGGISLEGSGSVSGNTANDNTRFGIQLFSSAADTVSGNIANFNSGDGIQVSFASKIQLSHNTANNNTANGFTLLFPRKTRSAQTPPKGTNRTASL